ncbi:MAG TPA: DUF4388 domain-containing protein [Pyrinomonadaceae bacterium]|nr:DUF4388 domain-containing protein [Pyrinomonadaceae bacterium]
MGIHGTLTTMSVSDLLQFMAAGRKTGTLKFSRGKVLKEIYFQGGIIVGSNTNDPKEYLGQVLIHYGKVDEGQLQAAMEVQRVSGERLGNILVKVGFLTESEVLEILRIRTLDIIYDLFVWEQAHFEFHDNEELPDDLIRIEVEPTTVIMEGIYRIDELARYKTVIPSDRAILEPGPRWNSSLNLSKEESQLLNFVERRMSVAEVCYNMHASSFHVYGLLFEQINNGVVQITGEAPEINETVTEIEEAPETAEDLLRLAHQELEQDNSEKALKLLQSVLGREPKNAEAQRLVSLAERKFIQHVYSFFSPYAVPKPLVGIEELDKYQLGPQEGFVYSRINGEWDVQSILSICPFREVDSLRMIKTLLEREVIRLDRN